MFWLRNKKVIFFVRILNLRPVYINNFSLVSWHINVNPLYTNGFFLLVWYNKPGIVHCIYLGVSGYILKCILLSEDDFYLNKQCRPWRLCTVRLGVSQIQRVNHKCSTFQIQNRISSPEYFKFMRLDFIREKKKKKTYISITPRPIHCSLQSHHHHGQRSSP